MARGKLALAHERRKLQLKATILSGRSQIAATQQKIKAAREELKSMAPRKNQGSDVGGLKTVRIR